MRTPSEPEDPAVQLAHRLTLPAVPRPVWRCRLGLEQPVRAARRQWACPWSFWRLPVTTGLPALPVPGGGPPFLKVCCKPPTTHIFPFERTQHFIRKGMDF